MGNRILRNDGGPLSLGHAYDANDKLISTRWVGGGPPGPITANFYYDGAGNLTSVTGSEFGAWTMSYDDESRPISIQYPTGTDSFVWNALGQRMRVTLNGMTYRYVYFGDRVLDETDDAGALVSRYSTMGPSYSDQWVASYNSGIAWFPATDGVGSTRQWLTSGNSAWGNYYLRAFGENYAGWDNFHNPYRFGGAWGYITDTPGSGLLQLGARFYWPELGRFIQQDPIGDGMNWYAYAENNPLAWLDPSGLWSDSGEGWYWGTVASWGGWVDRNLLLGRTANYGNTAGCYDAGLASAGQVAWAGAQWGTLLGVESYGAAKLAVKAGEKVAQRAAGLARVELKKTVSPRLLRQTGMSRKAAGRVHQEGRRVPHANIGGWHVIVNRHNWWKPWKWFVK